MLLYRIKIVAWTYATKELPIFVNDDNDDKGINIKEIEDASQGGVVFIDCDLKIVHNIAY